MDKGGYVDTQVDRCVQLDCSFRTAKSCPRKQGQVEVYRRYVQCIESQFIQFFRGAFASIELPGMGNKNLDEVPGSWGVTIHRGEPRA